MAFKNYIRIITIIILIGEGIKVFENLNLQ